MKQTNAKLILHPVRMKIIQSLINGKHLTVQQISERVGNVPQATLYRQLNTLLEAGFLEVTAENQVRGTLEKVYALKQPSIQSQEDLKKLSKEEHLQLFLLFQSLLIDQYENYLKNHDIDLIKDGVSYRAANLQLTDQEFAELTRKISDFLLEAMNNEPSPDRKSRNFATIIIPD
ncbi:helix-turn-helix domain-containing protein [Heyndrickxia acidicola]|uniref:Helix-turn-helix domain-containing protein n=1 Tax=Heyndrickxia acidicola TaxID=209389 RepID=A0ABU6MIJ4_9BACI|nr:helix-turn-helix domain-containing protein [Heyndrickxia acidicola]MED1203473.1 helix-turn-helix domain-containing protein [Heyndrickxia acidicola]